ncbi:small ribosomal subunit biogenesis GTPase RsgA [Amphritea balenae]|uniref:Small ribosomal subunit biogenesis GTPase RsgA n=1 Tax=Amphritea balenae TaxID=452629 RepID=A0A3P1SRG2_9GAMM|nr:small ribosomal subunit biogenesis GTPase RsgA [Amphritea balenae]RRC99747.1 small ribosomal subunit biogenesis GTPase RsgA [Amphritea balenae]GGK79509.1 putative ribosome biogenesis GTPase RsgA [Amphritea balenae]
MSKRKLTRRQAWRIKKIQDERTERAARKDSGIDQQLEGGELGPEQHGQIISHFGRQVDVEALEGEQQGQIIRCHMRTNLDALVTGDKVIWRAGNEHGVVVATQERHSILQRPNNHGELKPVAANIDQIVITIAVEPLAHYNLIDRYLIASELSQIEPIILLNKTDLINEDNRDRVEKMISLYTEIGYKVMSVSSTDKQGLAPLKAQLDDRISVFVGQSGVGKSSLINALLPGVDLKVGALSEATRKGTHTTTTARLFHFPDGGDLIDSPGIREFALWHIDEHNLLEGFREFSPFIGYCKFRDCNHEKEPGCAIKEAIEQGKISEQRVNSYKHILNSLNQD